MSLEDTELKIGGVNLKGVWIAIVVSIATTMAGGIWAVAEFYGRIEAVEEAVSGNGKAAEKLTVLGANLETIMENQKQLLDMRDRVSEVEKTMAVYLGSHPNTSRALVASPSSSSTSAGR